MKHIAFIISSVLCLTLHSGTDAGSIDGISEPKNENRFGVHLDVNTPHMYHFKSVVPLQYDLNLIAVVLADRNSGLTEINALPIVDRMLSDVLILEVPDGDRSIPGITKIVDSLATLPDIQSISPVFLNNRGERLIVNQQLLVQFDDHQKPVDVNKILLGGGIHPVEKEAWSSLPGSYKLKSQSKNGFEILAKANELAMRQDVIFAEPDMVFSGMGELIPNDPGFPECWGLDNTGQTILDSPGVADMDMDIPECWDVTQGDESIIVLIIDTGTEQDHPDINQNEGRDFTGSPELLGGPGNECDNHGTPVSGCVSATIDNGIGTVGAAPGCKTISARCFVSSLDCSGGWSANYSWTADALDWGESAGARVSNNSNYYGGTSAAVEALYESTRNNGMVHFSSSGNSSENSPSYPASLPTVNAIGAMDNTGNLAGFSNYGVGQSMTAPGAAIYSTDRTGAAGYSSTDYSFVWGTSFAAPYAAGCAALVLSIDDSLDAFEVEDILYSTARDLGTPGYDTIYGWGMVNANSAVVSVVESLCLSDLTGDSVVGVDDILQAIGQWGTPDGDCNNDGTTDVVDVLLIIEFWGSCP